MEAQSNELVIANNSYELRQFLDALTPFGALLYRRHCPPVGIRFSGRVVRQQLVRYDRRHTCIVINEWLQNTDPKEMEYARKRMLIQKYAYHLQRSCGNPPFSLCGSQLHKVFLLAGRLRNLAVEARLLLPLEEACRDLGFLTRGITYRRDMGGKALIDIGRKLSMARSVCARRQLSFEEFIHDCVFMQRTAALECLRAFEFEIRKRPVNGVLSFFGGCGKMTSSTEEVMGNDGDAS